MPSNFKKPIAAALVGLQLLNPLLASAASFEYRVPVQKLVVAKATPTLGAIAPYIVTEGDPAFTFAVPTSSSDGSWSFSSSDATIAAIDAQTGEVTPGGVGVATITATQAPTSKFGGAVATTTVTVEAAPPVGDPLYSTVSFLANFSNGVNAVKPTNLAPSYIYSAISQGTVDGFDVLKRDGANYYGQATYEIGVAGYLPGDFTIETYFKWLPGSATPVLFDLASTGSRNGSLRWDGTNWQLMLNGGNTTLNMGTTAPAQNVWHHIALTRTGTTVGLFVNGTLAGTAYYTSALGANDPGNKVALMNTAAGGSSFLGYLDEFRITKGASRYTVNFEVPPRPFPTE